MSLPFLRRLMTLVGVPEEQQRVIEKEAEENPEKYLELLKKYEDDSLDQWTIS